MSLLGAIAGDILGSVYEFNPVQRDDFPLWEKSCRFTDDTVLTIAIAKAVRLGWGDVSKTKELSRKYLREFALRHPAAGYGERFFCWVKNSSSLPYNSFGNGSAMRVSSVGWAYNSLEEVDRFAKATAEVSHNHPEGIKGAKAIAAAVFLARTGASKEEIRATIGSRYGYNLSRALADYRKSGYRFDVTCQGSVLPALMAFFESSDYESAVRLAIGLRGDADTQAAMAGSVAEAFYGFPPLWKERIYQFLSPDLLQELHYWETKEDKRL